MTAPVEPLKGRHATLPSIMRGLSILFLIAGIAALGYVAFVVVSARIFHVVESKKIERTASRPASPVAPSVLGEGDVIGEILIPRLDLSAIVVQGDSDDVLRHAVGHVPETALPGEAGNIALAGHRDTIFRPLRDIRVGDQITLRTVTGDHLYQVASTEVVPPSDVAVLQPHGENELTLITCFPFRYVGHAPNRFIVRAREVVQ